MSDTTVNDYYKMFAEEESKKVANANSGGGGNARPEMLKLEKGNKIKIRLIPNMKKVQMFKDYEHVLYKSRKDGTFRYLGRSPSDPSLGDERLKKDPIRSAQWKSYELVKGGSKEAIKESMALVPKRKQLVNCYVISDQKHPENNGTVKVFEYNAPLKSEKIEGKRVTSPTGEIYKKIYDAFSGEKKDRYGHKLIDLSPNGFSIEIEIGSKGEFNSYNLDLFQEDLHLDEETKKKILDQAYDLTEFLPKLKDLNEIESELAEHWWCEGDEKEEEEADLPDDDEDSSDAVEESSKSETSSFDWEKDDNLFPDEK